MVAGQVFGILDAPLVQGSECGSYKAEMNVRLIHGVLKQYWSNGMTRHSQCCSEGSTPSCCTGYDDVVQLAKDYTESLYVAPTPTDYMVIQNAMLQGYILAVEHTTEIVRARV